MCRAGIMSRALPGIPTIRVFEALACGIPLVSAPWDDAEGLFRPGEDFLVARDGDGDAGGARAAARGSGTRRPRSRPGGRGCLRGTPARIASTSFSRSSDTGCRRPTPPWGGGGMKIAFYGSSLLSSYWNGAATYYRGLIRALAVRGPRRHLLRARRLRPAGAAGHRAAGLVPRGRLEAGRRPGWPGSRPRRQADVVIKASGVGVLDDEILGPSWRRRAPRALRSSGTSTRRRRSRSSEAEPDHPLRRRCRGSTGCSPMAAARRSRRLPRLGARACVSIFNALDPTTHHPVAPDPRFAATSPSSATGCLTARRGSGGSSSSRRGAAGHRFLLGGAGWEPDAAPENVRVLGHVPTADHNAFNCTPRAVLNISRESMATRGFSPATRVFEAAGAAACLFTDAWEGIETILAPGREVIVARDGRDVAEALEGLTPERARAVGEAARARVLAEHTYDLRATQVEAILVEMAARRTAAA
jgi:spore maturation protein CgeB